MSKLAIDVIVPFHQQNQLLLEAISSIHKSTMKNIRIIAINDSGLTTTKSKLGLRESDLLSDSLNKGYRGALSTGIQFSSAEYISFLDSDDLIDSKKLEIQFEALEASQADLATGSILRFSKSISKSFRSPLSIGFISKLNQSEKSIFGAHGADSTILFRSSTLKATWSKHAQFPARLSDYGWLLSVLPSIKVIHCESATYYYRAHENQMSRTGNIRQEWLSVHPLWIDNVIAFLQENPGQIGDVSPSISQAISFPTSFPKLDGKERKQLYSLLMAIERKLCLHYPSEVKSIKHLVRIRIGIAYRGLHPRFLRYSILGVIMFLNSFIQGNRMRRL